MSDYRNVWALILAAGLLQVTGGILGVIAPIGLEALGVGNLAVGVIAALYSAGFMAGAWIAPKTISDIGNIRIFSAGAALLVTSTLAMYLMPDPWAWTVIRLVQGFAFAWMFAGAESWMSQATPAHARGGVLGFYHVIAKAALLAGPFLIIGAPILEAHAYIWAAIFIGLAMLPVCLTRRAEPPRHARDIMGPVKLLRMAPAAALGAFLAGVINTGTLALMPIYAQSIEFGFAGGSATGAAATALAVAWLGGMVTQWPAGRLSDRVDRRLVVAGMGALALVGAVGLAIGGTMIAPLVALAFIALWGAGSLSFYGVIIAHGIDRADPEDIAAAMSGLLFVWALGSVIGPPIAGAAMNTAFGVGGLFAFSATLLSALVAAMLIRFEQRKAPSPDERSDFEVVQPTSLAGVEIDPRSDPDLAPAD